MTSPIQYLTAEREDGTLLRARATPNGIVAYFAGKLVTVSGTILAYLVILLVPGLLILRGEVGVHSWPRCSGCCSSGSWPPSPSGPCSGR